MKTLGKHEYETNVFLVIKPIINSIERVKTLGKQEYKNKQQGGSLQVSLQKAINLFPSHPHPSISYLLYLVPNHLKTFSL